MIRTILLSTLLLSLATFVQSTWFGAIAVWGVIPDLALLILVWLSYKNGPVEGPVSGFLSGIVEDCVSVAPIGFHAFIRTFVAALSSLLHGAFYIDKIFLPVALGAGGTLAKALGAWLLSLVFGPRIQTYGFLDKVLWIEVAYNGLIAPLVFLLLGALRKLLVTDHSRE